jgi:hypothetical protein
VTLIVASISHGSARIDLFISGIPLFVFEVGRKIEVSSTCSYWPFVAKTAAEAVNFSRELVLKKASAPPVAGRG